MRTLNSLWKQTFGDDFGNTVVDTFNQFSRRTHEIVETGSGENTLYVSVPGYTHDDLSIEMQDGQLTITGQIPDNRHPATSLVSDKLQLSFNVTPDYKVEDATLENGLLAVRLVRFKKTEAVKIVVNSSL